MESNTNMDLYRWKDHFFSSKTDIYKGERKVGSVKQRYFRKDIRASIFDARYVFRSKGVFKGNVDIWEASSMQKIGKIRFHSWGCKSDIILDEGKTIYHWKYSNLWNTKWELRHENQRVLYSKSKCSSGKTNNYAEDIDPILLLSAYYVYSHYKQQFYALAMFLPIIAVASG